MMAFTRAVREAARLKIGIQGPSGSGKTMGALLLARAIVGPKGRIAVADSENKTASLYSDRVEFDTLDITPPYLTEKWEQAIADAVEGEYDVLVLDSISHQWSGEGGILSRKEALDRQPGSNSFTNWAKFTPETERFKAAISNAPLHIIATLRAKQDYVLAENGRGKQMPQKVGMAPVQREGMEYEFSVVFELQMTHDAIVSKDRTGLFDAKDAVYDLKDKKLGERITKWLKTAKPLPTAAEIAEQERIEQEQRAEQAEFILRTTTRLPGSSTSLHGHGGKLVSEVDDDALLVILKGLRERDDAIEAEGRSRKFDDVCEAIGLVMLKRQDDAAAAAGASE